VTELVSILIPAYNAERWLAATLKSALDQTWPRVEVIVVDDGSKDGTLTVAKRFENRSVKVTTQRNMGAPAARNKALELAQGTYIQWLDADDLLEPTKISAQMRVADQQADRSLLLSGAFGTFYYRAEKAIFAPNSLWRDLTTVDYFLTRFTDNVYFQTGAWLVSRELSDATGPWTDFDSPDDDGEYFCRMVARSTGVKFVADARTYYRVGNFGSVAKARSARIQTALFRSKRKCIEYLLSLEDSPRSRAACVHLLQDWLLELQNRDDLVMEARQLANELGGELQTPALKWKYRPLAWLFGRNAAIQASSTLPRLRTRAAREWDRMMYEARHPRDMNRHRLPWNQNDEPVR
jgi:glycosyltransferase involved in cell wall biosynthesis